MFLVTGALGFLGQEIIASLARAGIKRVRCMVRPGTENSARALELRKKSSIELEMCPVSMKDAAQLATALTDVEVVYHAAAAMSGSHASMIYDTVVGSETLYQACVDNQIDSFVLVSSFSVIGVATVPCLEIIDESIPMEDQAELRDPYSFSKHRQEQLAWKYFKEKDLPLVVVRPGVIFGSARPPMTPRIGIDVFGVFLHLGRKALIPLTYVENCADAIVAAGLSRNVVGETFCVVDDELPSSAYLLRRFRQDTEPLRVIHVPAWLLRTLSRINVLISAWSDQQFPVVFKPYDILCYWTERKYSNAKAKRVLSWNPRIRMSDALDRSFERSRRRTTD